MARLRREKEDVARLQAENARLTERLAEMVASDSKVRTLTPEQEAFKQQGIDRLNSAKRWMLAFHLFAEEHDGVFPTDFAQALAKSSDAFNVEGMSPDQFEIVYSGKVSDLKEPNKVIVIREKEPRSGPDGRITKTYGFADGHSEVHYAPNGDFEKWEGERMVAGPAQ